MNISELVCEYKCFWACYKITGRCIGHHFIATCTVLVHMHDLRSCNQYRQSAQMTTYRWSADCMRYVCDISRWSTWTTELIVPGLWCAAGIWSNRGIVIIQHWQHRSPVAHHACNVVMPLTRGVSLPWTEPFTSHDEATVSLPAMSNLSANSLQQHSAASYALKTETSTYMHAAQ